MDRINFWAAGSVYACDKFQRFSLWLVCFPDRKFCHDRVCSTVKTLRIINTTIRLHGDECARNLPSGAVLIITPKTERSKRAIKRDFDEKNRLYSKFLPKLHDGGSSGGSDLKSRLIIPDGTIEAIKWLSLFLMTLDHVNKYLFAERFTIIFDAGRVVMPLFAFVLSYNLARLDCINKKMERKEKEQRKDELYFRVMKRLALFGVIATPFYIGLGGVLFGWYPLNILFLLFIGTAIIYFFEKTKKNGSLMNGFLIMFLFWGAGLLVEFWMFGLLFMIASSWYVKTKNKIALLLMFAAGASLYVVNHNFWALGAMPIILLAPYVDIKMPRIGRGRLFYAYYPLHLAVILAVQKIL